MNNIALEVENVSKQYRLGEIGTGTLSHDLNRFWARMRGKDDPFLKIGETNDRTQKGESDYVWALKDINFKIEQGDAVGIIGRNGAGKSTLLKLLSKVTAPTTGNIKVRGRIASLLEVGTGFHPEMTGRENIFLNGAILGMTKKEIKRKFDEIVDFSGVERYIDTPVKRYSSGMYVRLAFAVAAHLESEILIVDEVLAVGDSEFQKKCLGKMGDVSRGEGRTVLFVSHNMAAVKTLCNRGIILQNGGLDIDTTVDDAIDYYLNRGGIIKEGKSIMENMVMMSNEIQIDTVTLNDSPFNNIELRYPSRDLKIEIKGRTLNSLKIAVECSLFDENEILLGKYAPALNDKLPYLTSPGEFTIQERFSLPNNISNGNYYLQIELTQPRIAYLAIIPKGLKIHTVGYMTDQGISLDQNLFGFLYL